MLELIFIIEDGTLTKFEADEYVEELYIPEQAIKIGCEAFREALVGKVIIPYGTTTIEADAFVDCELNEIEISDSVTTIETWAFSGCEFLRKITIPDSVTFIGPWAIGYREDHFQPWLSPIPLDKPVTIIGKAGSEAQRYAEEYSHLYFPNSINFKEI